MRFLIDAQLPPALAGWLRKLGHDADHVADLGLLGSTDQDIASRAAETDAVLVTKDEDFVTLRMSKEFRLLWLRCGNCTKAALEDWLTQRWSRIEQQLADHEPFVEVR